MFLTKKAFLVHDVLQIDHVGDLHQLNTSDKIQLSTEPGACMVRCLFLLRQSVSQSVSAHLCGNTGMAQAHSALSGHSSQS